MKANETTQRHDNSPLHLLHRAGQCADELFTLNIGATDITPRQFEVLKAIDQSDEPSQTQLVTKTGIDRSTLADIVRRLVQRGLVERQRTSRDARTYAVRLTNAGEAVFAGATPAVEATNSTILASVPVADREIFLQALKRIVIDIEMRDSQKTEKAGSVS